MRTAFPPDGIGFKGLGLQTPQADLDALADLVRQLGRRRQTGLAVVEVGSWTGRSALAMAEAWDDVMVYCVDTWQGTPHDATGSIVRRLGGDRVFEAFCANVGPRLLTSLVPCRGPSLTWAAVWPFEVDLVYLDGDHDYDAVRDDIRAWLPHVAPGGILCGHDYGEFPGVAQAVDELIPGRGRAGYSLWWTEIPDQA